MASFFQSFSTCFLLVSIFTSLHFLTGISVEFDVGGNTGWVIPPSKNDDLYNDWASKNRFKVNDTLIFTYKKDSVMEVTKEEYEKCRSLHPMFFSNNGNTIYALDRSGLFYFISGVSGHCERGLKMIIKVLDVESTPQSANQTANTSSPAKSAAATYFGTSMMMVILAVLGVIIVV
ncbi:early nodulin-like protein 6 [Coffea arabica]|uniref:Early nodulin-like protein 6 n=1 Tax=Coffea arabica TaxID=13443 RepID=A0A6P6XD79_COFAR|nr:early nodulin-like protein 1 [Coffea arabica]